MMLRLVYRESYNGMLLCQSDIVDCEGAILEGEIIFMFQRDIGMYDWELVHTKERVYRVYRNDEPAGYVFVHHYDSLNKG